MTSSQPEAPGYLRTNAGQWTIAAVLVALFVVLAWLQRVPSLTTADDDATYVLLARSLRDGGYNSIHLVGAPFHTKYPPVFPALIAGVSALVGESIDAFAAMNIALSVAGLVLIFAAAKRLLPPVVALGALAMAATSPFLQGISGTVMSEPAFLGLIALTVWTLSRMPLTPRAIAIACVFATLAVLTRTAGVTLVVAVIALLVLERQWRAAALYGGLIALVVVGVSLWLRARAMPELAADYISDVVTTGSQQRPNPAAVVGGRVLENAPQYAGTLLWVLSVPAIGGTIVDNLFWLIIACVALGAGLVFFWRTWKIVPLFAATYGALLLVWPWVLGRFLIPLLPLLAAVFLTGIHVLVSRWGPRAASAAVIAVVAIIAFTGVSRAAIKVATRSQCEREQAMLSPSCFNADQLSFFAAARYIGEQTPPSSIVLSAKEGTFFYLSNRRLVPSDSINALPTAAAAEFLKRQQVAYAVVSHVSFEGRPLSDRLLSACEYLEPAAEFPPRTTVFRVMPSPSPGSQACEILKDYRRDAEEFLPQIF